MAAQDGLCLDWSETPEDTFCRVVAHLFADRYIVRDTTAFSIKLIAGLAIFGIEKLAM